MREVVARLNDRTPEMRFVVHESADEHVSESIATAGVWEPFESELILRLLGAFGADGTVPIFVDCGANIGWYSVLAGVNGAKVVAFEPMPANAALLRENHDRNEFPTVRSSWNRRWATARGLRSFTSPKRTRVTTDFTLEK